MLNLIARRLALGLLVAFTVMTLAFMLTRLSGDLAISIAGPSATQADVEIVRKAYGLDRPLYVQFFTWVGRAMIGDFGQSYFFKDSVANLIGRRLPITLTLGLVGLSLALVISIPLGIMAALRENSWVDRGVTMFTMVGQAIPSFWLALILMIVLGLNLGILPISGTGTWQHFVMPGIVLAFTAIPALTRLTRSGMIEAMASDYIRTARAKGLSEKTVIIRHALPLTLLRSSISNDYSKRGGNPRGTAYRSQTQVPPMVRHSRCAPSRRRRGKMAAGSRRRQRSSIVIASARSARGNPMGCDLSLTTLRHSNLR